MKNVILVVLFFCPVFATAQIEIRPAGSLGFDPFTANINGEKNKPFWIGVGSHPHIYLDSSANHKVGIGSAIKAPLGTFKHNYHAKLHVRHIGGPGSNFNTQAGPHLLLDEATSASPSVLRFRQSTTTTSGVGAFAEETLVIGSRYWDIRGFANSSSTTAEGLGDFLDFINSGSLTPEPILSLRGGTGRVGINTDNPLSRLHVIGDGRFSPTSNGEANVILDGLINSIKMGSSGQQGIISYETVSHGMRFSTDNNLEGMRLSDNKLKVGSHATPEATLDVDGFSILGDSPSAPKIKTWYGEAYLPANLNAVSNHNILPVQGNKILSCQVMVSDTFGSVISTNHTVFDGRYFDYAIDGTIIRLYTSSNSFYVNGMLARIFITYTE